MHHTFGCKNRIDLRIGNWRYSYCSNISVLKEAALLYYTYFFRSVSWIIINHNLSFVGCIIHCKLYQALYPAIKKRLHPRDVFRQLGLLYDARWRRSGWSRGSRDLFLSGGLLSLRWGVRSGQMLVLSENSHLAYLN